MVQQGPGQRKGEMCDLCSFFLFCPLQVEKKRRLLSFLPRLSWARDERRRGLPFRHGALIINYRTLSGQSQITLCLREMALQMKLHECLLHFDAVRVSHATNPRNSDSASSVYAIQNPTHRLILISGVFTLVFLCAVFSPFNYLSSWRFQQWNPRYRYATISNTK